MGAKKFDKNAKEFAMFQDYWKIVQAYWIVESTDEEKYWDSLMNDINRFLERYPTDFAKRLAIDAFLAQKEDEARKRW